MSSNYPFFTDKPQANAPCTAVVFGLGCFWGAEKLFATQPNVLGTLVGYAGGHTSNPTYETICTGKTGHAEVVQIFFEPHPTHFEHLLTLFWQNHNPTEGMRQGNDIGPQYRSVIYCSTTEHFDQAIHSRNSYQNQLDANEFGPISTEIETWKPFYIAERYHQHYLEKNPNGYCQLRGTGIACQPA